jgi:hypothetical protein
MRSTWAGVPVHLLVVATLAAMAATCASTGATSTSDPAKAAFLQRVKDYVALRQKADETLPRLSETDTPAKISAHEHALADLIRKQRADVREGDVFGPAHDFFVHTIREDWHRRSAAAREAIMGELPGQIRPTINTPYPTTYPLITFPPTLFEKLPTLPDGLEYRLLGAHLILRDVKSNLIVDVIPDVITVKPGREAQ